MKLRTSFDPFRLALWSALGATQLVACGGTAVRSGGNAGESGGGSPAVTLAGGGAGGATSGQGGVAAVGGTSGGHGGAAAGGATAGAPAGGAASANQHPCSDPQRANDDGFVQCTGFRHRESQRACVSKVPRAAAVPHQTAGACDFDADCTEKPYGWCSNVSQVGNTYCEYGCVQDSDCASGELCDCGDPVGRCVPANCVVDADCQDGFLCRSYDSSGGCGMTVYQCQSPADACGTDADCTSSTLAQCRVDATTHSFQCVPGGCAIGRPFLVEGVQRLAPIASNADWIEPASRPQQQGLDAALRAQLVEQWTFTAAMEHASVAAFARFTLQLMQHGAPAWLIERATAAMADETKHAKACFAIASSYLGAPLGPGPLAVERSLDESSLQAIVLNAIHEGCVGETVAAIEAREAAEHAADPALRELLLVIAEDETRHAQLAYAFVKWALELGDRGLERAVRREFEKLAAQSPPTPLALTDLEATLLGHGIVPAALRESIRGQAISEVILPCSRALFAPRAQAASVS